MVELSAIEYLGLSKGKRFNYKLKRFFISIPKAFKNLGIKIGKFFKAFGLKVWDIGKDIVLTFKNGDWKTRVSYGVMGFGSCARGQVGRGILFFLMEVVFILFMVFVGGKYLGKFYCLGSIEKYQVLDEFGQLVDSTNHDNSFNILLYSVLSIFFIIAFVYTWYINIKQNRIGQEIEKENKKLATTKDDLKALVDRDFYKTLLALPTLGIIIFTVLPIFFMILIAFTNYDSFHYPDAKLFGWVGFENFGTLFSIGDGAGSFSMTFGNILIWTLVWAFFATFTNYFLGMVVAMLINKKGIKLKKLWRTVLVLSIAIPQFISLLYVSKLFDASGFFGGAFKAMFGYGPFERAWSARITVILINVWIGIPYLMLIITGILMNVPADLYESASIDGANAWQQYTKITLPYMLFITGPYLLTSFTGNMNNFNVIYLLTGGGPVNPNYYQGAGDTDLLITWLYSMTVTKRDYKLASVIGIMVFLIVAVLSLVVYNLLPSMKNEEEFQ